MKRSTGAKKTDSDGIPLTRIHVWTNEAFLNQLDTFRDKLFRVTGQKTSRSWIMREGAIRLMKSYRIKMFRAEKGILHGKQRN